MYETLLRAAEEAGGRRFLPVFKDRARRGRMPLGFDDGTVFSRGEIGRTLIPPCLPGRRQRRVALSGYIAAQPAFGREAIGSHRFRPDIRYAEDLAVHRRLHVRREMRCRGGQGVLPLSFQRQRDSAFQLAGELCENPTTRWRRFGGCPECMRRMKIRRRKMAVGTVRNFCYPGTPYVLGSACAGAQKRHNEQYGYRRAV